MCICTFSPYANLCTFMLCNLHFVQRNTGEHLSISRSNKYKWSLYLFIILFFILWFLFSYWSSYFLSFVFCTGYGKSGFTVVSMQNKEFVLVLLFINNCIIFQAAVNLLLPHPVCVFSLWLVFNFLPYLHN